MFTFPTTFISSVVGDAPFSGHASLVTDLISYWRADTNGSFPDAHSTNNGTINGATYTASGKINGAYDFDGVNDNITVADSTSLDLGTGDFTINFWVNPASLADNDNLLADYSSADRGWYIHMNSGAGAVRVITWDGIGLTNVPATGDSYLTTGSWQMITVIREGTTHKIYKNGANLVSGTGTVRDLDNIQFEIGSIQGSNFYDGDMDEIGVWKKAISAGELSDLYNSGSGLQY